VWVEVGVAGRNVADSVGAGGAVAV